MINPLTSLGYPSPLGTEISDQGVNFSLFSRTASGVDLLLFDRDDDDEPDRIVTLDKVAKHEQQRVSLTQLIAQANKALHGVQLERPDWGSDSHSIAFSAKLREVKILVYLILNGYCEPLDFELPKPQSGTPWKRWIDTSLPSPNDIVEWQLAPEISGATYRVPGHSAIMLYTAARQDSTDPSDRELS